MADSNSFCSCNGSCHLTTMKMIQFTDISERYYIGNLILKNILVLWLKPGRETMIPLLLAELHYLLKDVVLNTFLVNQTSTVVILASSIRICFNNVSLTDAKEYRSFEFLQWNIVTHIQTLKCLAVYQPPYSLAHLVLSCLFFDELSDYLENILMCPETLLVSQTSSISTLTTLSIMMPESFETWKPLDSHSMLWYQPIHVATPWILYF